MGGWPHREGSIDPGELLRSALEKIVFFECRVAQLDAELTAARQVAERARADAAVARTHEAEASRALAAEREARAGLALREVELSERVRLLEAERERLLSGLVERARLGGAAGADGAPGPEEGGAELASFIAELRAELESLRAWKEAVLAAQGGPSAATHATFLAEAAASGAARGAARPEGAPAAPRSAAGATLDELAGAFRAGGRTGVGAVETAQLKAFLTTHADLVLWERAMADLSAADPADRLRAIAHLEALGARAAAPLLAAALGREPEAGVKVELLKALARFEEPFAADLAARELGDARPEVRAAALTALATLAEGGVEPRLVAALSDPSPLVRRRAAVLLNACRGPLADEALVAALRDPDAGVARAAAVALTGRQGEQVRRALLRHETGPRARAQGRTAGLDEAVRDAPGPAALRVAERLAQAEAQVATPSPAQSPARAQAATVQAEAPAQVPVTVQVSVPVQAPVAPRAPTFTSAGAAPRVNGAARAAVAVLEVAPAPAAAGTPGGPSDAAFDEAVVLEVRGALRGRTAAELTVALDAAPARVEAALAGLHARGALTRRGDRWWFT